MHITVVEDDHAQSKSISEHLKQAFPNASIELIKTEAEFRRLFESRSHNLPHVIVLDMMLRWTDPGPDMKPPPEEVGREGFYRAGFRCVRFLKAREKTKDIPVIICSVLERSDLENDLNGLPPGVKFMHKSKETFQTLADHIRQLT